MPVPQDCHNPQAESDLSSAARAVGSAADELRGLMEGYQGGDKEAFRELHRRLEPELLAYLTSLTMARTQAEDLVQETFLAVHRSRQTYLPGRAVKPWVLAIARYMFLQDRRKTVRRRQLETSCAVPDVLIPGELKRLADQEVIGKALARLAPDRRESVLLHHALGLSFREIGRLLGVNAGTAKVRAHRGMSELREILGGGTDGETTSNG